jgi:4'-phosphopantetheinyl transferase EntD
MNSPFPADIAFVWLEGATGSSRVEALSPGEHTLAAAMGAPRRKEQFALGRACAREALRRLGAPPPAEVLRGPGRQPRWPEGYVGSITHSAGRAAAAAAQARAYRGVGIDLERLRQPSAGLLARIARPPERAALEALPPLLLAAALVALFSAKEALYKAANPLTGVYLGFQDAAVRFAPGTAWDGAGGDFAWIVLKDCGPGFPSGTGGVGRWLRQGDWVLSGAWLAASANPPDA